MDFCLHLGIGILQGLDPSGFDGFPGAGIESVRRLFVMFQRTAYGGGQKNQAAAAAEPLHSAARPS